MNLSGQHNIANGQLPTANSICISCRMVEYGLVDRMWITRRASFVRGLTLTVLAAWIYPIPIQAGAVETRAVPGHLPAVLARLQPMGRLAASTQLRLAVGLPLRNAAALSGLLEQICNPASSNYRHCLTAEQFTERFGPTEQECQAVVDFLRARGLTVSSVHPNRLVLEVSGTAAAIERAFSVRLWIYRHPTEGRMFYAPDSEPQVERGIHILHISGLDNFVLPRPAGLRPRPSAPGAVRGLLPVRALGSAMRALIFARLTSPACRSRARDNRSPWWNSPVITSVISSNTRRSFVCPTSRWPTSCSMA